MERKSLDGSKHMTRPVSLCVFGAVGQRGRDWLSGDLKEKEKEEEFEPGELVNIKDGDIVDEMTLVQNWELQPSGQADFSQPHGEFK